MKRVLSLLVVIAAILGFCWAQNSSQPQTTGAAPPQGTNQPAAQAGGPSQISAGTVIPAQLSKSIDAKKSKAGDKVEAKTTMDLLSHGEIVIPRNAKIIGHITDAKPHTKESPDSKIEIAFDRLLLKDGRELPLQASIQALSRPEQLASVNDGGNSSGNSPMSENPGAMPSAGGAAGGSMGAPGRSTSPRTTGPTYGSGGTTGETPQGATPAGVGALSPSSQGVVGMPGLSLSTSAQGSTISSEKDNVHLDGGTQLILRTTGK